ncbi:glycosyl transferase [Candidatus Falkowbacteria bacterium CG_4_10_14_0_2_um_filter_41_15]|uniref:Glycosyl transferase n=2 Tax=Candidatus Falkowiibacteriota TaxID=1752728 RepID=A0A2M7VZY8_9BACT|nr:MAG: glycosyl transferase [Candidatus Falkowbacteria bacterium CG_4_10_14_0_2_um_filter_41_15]
MKLAPVALFVYNRPWHTQKTIEALEKNELASETDLIIFSDGPKDNDLSRQQVAEVRQYLKEVNGFKSVKIIERAQNYGLGKSIIAGVTETINHYGRIIVLEDDIITSRYFLKYLNEGLNLYENDNQVISIHSYIYPVKERLPEIYFLKGADCQGWATWKRGWDLFEPDGRKILAELETKNLTKEFDFNGAYPYTQLLKDQIAGKNSSWAVRWYGSAFLKNKLTLYPGESLIYNTGFDGSGANCGIVNIFNKTAKVENIKINMHRIEIKENLEAKKSIMKFFRTRNNFLLKFSSYLKNPKSAWKKIRQKLNV